MARKLSKTRIAVETLVVAGIFIVVHLPIYPPYGGKAEKATTPAEACVTQPPRTDAWPDGAAARPHTPCPDTAPLAGTD